MTAPLPLCPCGHVLAIHGPRGCVAASGCGCRKRGLSLPLLATTTGGRNPEKYCSPCLSLWQRAAPEAWRAGMHPACREVLEAIHATPAEEIA